jgi:hypothetical protein
VSITAVVEDFVDGATRPFLVELVKSFKHEMVYNVLRKCGLLPKYEIDMVGIDSLLVLRTLLFVTKTIQRQFLMEKAEVLPLLLLTREQYLL